MFLYKLELQGFKSFVDKTEIEFGAGITGVIGPNGCGKTNVSDAIRWVMGEQSARQLRGDSMEDVIFNGSPARKPLGLAEVHLTFKNDRGILPTEFSEVTISRRVFRSGMSEYFINRTPCRLRDVRDLFFDTGMGSHAYSVIERQMVDQVLSDGSGHRRFLFEEAAGITKYKARKKETLNKLDATEGDLTRLNDIVFELERELRSLARQVGKARRYQRLRDEIRDLDLQLTAGQVEELKRREAEAKDQWQEEAVRREGVNAALAAIEAGLNDQKLALLELERELTTAQGGLHDREEARTQAEHQVVLLRERAAGLARRAGEDAAEAARMRERLAEVAAREQEAGERRAQLRGEREVAQTAAEAAETELHAHESDLRERRDVVSGRKQLSLDLFSAEAERRGACERILARHAALIERREAAESRVRELEARRAEVARASASGRARRGGLTLELDEARRMLAGVDQKLEAHAAQGQSADAALGKLRQEAAAAESRLTTLLELKRSFDGVSEGVKSLFSEGDRLPGLIGVVADVLEVPARYLDALEASLGEASAFVLTEDRAGLEAALERLRGLDGGRATLVDLSTLSAGSEPQVPRDSGVVGRASDLVRCEERYRPLVERLLGAVVVVEDRAAAARLATGAEGGLRFVSLDGEVWERGRVRAGSARNLSGLLHREMQIRELTGQVAELSLAIEAMEHERGALDARRRALLADRTTAASEVDVRRETLEGLAREVEAAEHEGAWAASEADERRREIAAYEAELETVVRARVQAEADLAEYQQQLERARLQLADLDGALHALETARDACSTRAHAARETLLRLAREEGEWDSQWARAEQTRRELEAGVAGRIEDERAARAKVTEIEAEVNGLAAGLTGLLESESSQRERVVALQTRMQALKTEVQEGEEVVRQKRFEQTELGELLHQVELDRVQTRAELDRTFERLRTEYDMDPAAWTPQPAPEGFDADEARSRLEEARGRFRGLGAVNLLALEDYGKKKERYQFLTQQREDLLRAKSQLLEAIEKINVTASQLFSETFVRVQEHFRDIFKTLFEGGDSELRMVGEDPLECEIEIAARPRGKHLQSISLMSGGERALTAIALLFAIYLVKPSPFCLLDEVDAPLDDANVERFLKMLQRFSGRTQFVVITHNKKTMESADGLYGVTMQELGISKLVSVKFDDRRAAAREPGELEVATTA
ncbi:MAG: chromosome segregation protein SMC [Candidatus Eisenbacteria bacterium RBG_16_71_46]|nr:MAG: chromosome segregation protein SMC [Candidatus Eisenbacteria bacterium RBG_16_71_46]